MAGTEATCQRCGADQGPYNGQRNALREDPGGVLANRQEARQPHVPTTVLGNLRASSETPLEAERRRRE
jgi:hypothetical protein